MIKKLSLAAILALGAFSVAAPPASASGCPPTIVGFGPSGPIFGPDPECPTEIPTPPAVLAAIGMGLAGLKKKKASEEAGE